MAAFRLGIEEVLRQRTQDAQKRDRAEGLLDHLRQLGEEWRGWLQAFTAQPDSAEGDQGAVGLFCIPACTQVEPGVPPGACEGSDILPFTRATGSDQGGEVFEHFAQLPGASQMPRLAGADLWSPRVPVLGLTLLAAWLAHPPSPPRQRSTRWLLTGGQQQ